MEQEANQTIPEDRRIRLLNYLLRQNEIPEYGEFNLKELISRIPPEQYKALFGDHPEFDTIWRKVDMPASLSDFMVENDLAKPHGENLQLTSERGRDLQKQGSYNKLLQDERYITNEARRVSELELEANRMFRRQYNINVLIATGTIIAAIYYLLEILNNFFGFYPYHH